MPAVALNSKDLLAVFQLLTSAHPDYQICEVKHPPEGFNWCVVGKRFYIAAELAAGIVTSARSFLPRLRLVVVDGARIDRPVQSQRI